MSGCNKNKSLVDDNSLKTSMAWSGSSKSKAATSANNAR